MKKCHSSHFVFSPESYLSNPAIIVFDYNLVNNITCKCLVKVKCITKNFGNSTLYLPVGTKDNEVSSFPELDAAPCSDPLSSLTNLSFFHKSK